MEREQSTAERLLIGAATLFREKGYAGTTTRELSSLLGLQNASLYHHINGKEDLLFQLCVGALENVAACLSEAIQQTDDPLAQLELMARNYSEIALEDRDRHATMLIDIRALSDERRHKVVQVRDANVKHVEDAIRRAQAANQVRDDIDAKYLTLALFNLLNWSIFWWRPDGDIGTSELGDILWRVYSGGVTTL